MIIISNSFTLFFLWDKDCVMIYLSIRGCDTRLGITRFHWLHSIESVIPLRRSRVILASSSLSLTDEVWFSLRRIRYCWTLLILFSETREKMWCAWCIHYRSVYILPCSWRMIITTSHFSNSSSPFAFEMIEESRWTRLTLEASEATISDDVQ